jgi:hypothetical protein
MLTPSEKRFLKYWEEQRRGGRLPYHLLYILAGTFIASIVTVFVSMMFGMGFPDYVPLFVAGSFVLVTVATVTSWQVNEKKFRALIRREVKEGKNRDELPASSAE